MSHLEVKIVTSRVPESANYYSEVHIRRVEEDIPESEYMDGYGNLINDWEWVDGDWMQMDDPFLEGTLYAKVYHRSDCKWIKKIIYPK